MPPLFEISTFTDLLHETFTLRLDSSTSLALELIQVKSLSSSSNSGKSDREPFSIEFSCQNETVLEQKMYTFYHPRMGTFEIFIVPVAKDVKGVYYEAVFA